MERAVVLQKRTVGWKDTFTRARGRIIRDRNNIRTGIRGNRNARTRVRIRWVGKIRIVIRWDRNTRGRVKIRRDGCIWGRIRWDRDTRARVRIRRHRNNVWTGIRGDRNTRTRTRDRIRCRIRDKGMVGIVRTRIRLNSELAIAQCAASALQLDRRRQIVGTRRMMVRIKWDRDRDGARIGVNTGNWIGQGKNGIRSKGRVRTRIRIGQGQDTVISQYTASAKVGIEMAQYATSAIVGNF